MWRERQTKRVCPNVITGHYSFDAFTQRRINLDYAYNFFFDSKTLITSRSDKTEILMEHNTFLTYGLTKVKFTYYSSSSCL